MLSRENKRSMYCVYCIIIVWLWYIEAVTQWAHGVVVRVLVRSRANFLMGILAIKLPPYLRARMNNGQGIYQVPLEIKTCRRRHRS